MGHHEEALVGWNAIDEWFKIPLTKAQKRKLRKAGVIFQREVGRPPKRRKVVFTLPSLLQRYLMREGKI